MAGGPEARWFTGAGTTRKLDRESSSFEVGSVLLVVSKGSRGAGASLLSCSRTKG